jgi:hypothetical protein
MFARMNDVPAGGCGSGCQNRAFGPWQGSGGAAIRHQEASQDGQNAQGGDLARPPDP